MKYLYTAPNCPRCHDLKKHYSETGVEFIERDSSRLTSPCEDRDNIDRDALATLSMQQMVLPVEVDVDE